MDERLFDELVESIREAGAYLRGEAVPVRITVLGEGHPGEFAVSRASARRQRGQLRRITKVATRTTAGATFIPSPTQSVGEGGASQRAG